MDFLTDFQTYQFIPPFLTVYNFIMLFEWRSSEQIYSDPFDIYTCIHPGNTQRSE